METNRAVLQRTPAYSWWVLISATLNFMCVFIGMNTTAVFGVEIMKEWGINEAQVSLLTTALMIPFALMPVIASNFTSKLGIHKLVIIGMLCNIGASIGIGFWGNTFISVIIFRVIQGMCGGIMDNSMVQNASLYFPTRQRGFATGILMGFLGVGFSVTSIMGSWVYNTFHLSWQMTSMWITVIPSVVCLVLYLATVKDFYQKYPGVESMDDLLPPDKAAAENKYDKLFKPSTMKEVLHDKRCWASSIYGFFTALPTYGLAYVLPLYLQEDKGISMATASAMIGATFVFKLVAAPLGGLLSDHVFHGVRWPSNVIGHALGGALIIAVGLMTGLKGSALQIMLIIMFTAVSLYGGTFWTWPSALCKPSAQYEVSGLIVTVSNIAAVIAAPVSGVLISYTGHAASAILMIGIGALVGVIPAYLSKI